MARSPFDSKTTNRPSPLILPANDSNVELVIWLISASTWAEAETAKVNKEIIAKNNDKLDFTDSSRKIKGNRKVQKLKFKQKTGVLQAKPV